MVVAVTARPKITADTIRIHFRQFTSANALATIFPTKNPATRVASRITYAISFSTQSNWTIHTKRMPMRRLDPMITGASIHGEDDARFSSMHASLKDPKRK